MIAYIWCLAYSIINYFFKKSKAFFTRTQICFIFLRLQQQQTKTKKPTSHTASWKHKTEIEKELAQATQQPQQPKQITTIVKDHSLAVDGLFFTCPVYPACLPFDEIHEHVRQSLLKDLEDEPLMISVTLIHTLNRDKIKKEAAITILCKYLSLIHIWRCRRSTLCRSRWSPYH